MNLVNIIGIFIIMLHTNVKVLDRMKLLKRLYIFFIKETPIDTRKHAMNYPEPSMTLLLFSKPS